MAAVETLHSDRGRTLDHALPRIPKDATLYAPADAAGVRTLVGSIKSGFSLRWSLAGVNRGSSQVSITLNLPSAAEATFNRYYYFDGDRVTDSNGFPGADGNVTATSDDNVTLVIPASSMVMLTNA